MSDQRAPFDLIPGSSNHQVADGIAVVGMACWYPGARNPRQLWENVLARRREFRLFPDERMPLADYWAEDATGTDFTYQTKVAVIDGFVFDWAGYRIPRQAFQITEVAQWLALDVARQAIEDAGFNRTTLPKDNTGVLIGNTNGGEYSRTFPMRFRWPFIRRVLKATADSHRLPEAARQALSRTMEQVYLSVFPPATEDYAAGNISATIAGRIANYFDMHGGHFVIDAACASSLISVANGCQMLVDGDLDLAVAGGVDISLDPHEMVGFSKVGALAKQDIMPFDRRSTGFLPSEGCGFVVLKRLEDARKSGDRIYAVIRGWGMSSDGKGGIMQPTSRAQAMAIGRAYARAGYSPRDLEFVECHGTATVAGDRTELEGLSRAMGDSEDAPARTVGVTAIKSIIGHAKAAAGIASFIKTVSAVNRHVAPPTANCEQPHPQFDTVAKRLYPIRLGRQLDPQRRLRAGVSAFGFGGINAHIAIESYGPPATELAPSIDERALMVSGQDTEILVLAAGSVRELQGRIAELQQEAARHSQSDLTDLAAHLALQVSGDAPVRAAMIASNAVQLVERLAALEKALASGSVQDGRVFSTPERDVWVGIGAGRTRCGFLMPGQGSQQLLMARTLAERFAWARELVARADGWVGDGSSEPLSEVVYRPLDRSSGSWEVEGWTRALTQTQNAQPAVCLASVLYARFLQRLGIEPRVVAGHSLGELTALHLAGAFDEETLIRIAAVRGELMGSSVPGGMVGVACPVDRAESLAGRVSSGPLVVANINSPRQTVLSGAESAIEEVIKLASGDGISVRRLPVSNAFHSPLMARAAEELQRRAPIPAQAAALRIKVLSSVDGASITTTTALPEHLSRQLVARVNFIRVIEEVQRECDFLLEVGPGRVLSGLASDNFGQTGAVCLPVASDPLGAKDLNVSLACAFTHGVPVRWAAAYENRLARPYVPPSKKIFISNPLETPLPVLTDAAPLELGSPGALLPMAAAAGFPAALPAGEPGSQLAVATQMLAQGLSTGIASWLGALAEAMVRGQGQPSLTATGAARLLGAPAAATGGNGAAGTPGAALLHGNGAAPAPTAHPAAAVVPPPRSAAAAVPASDQPASLPDLLLDLAAKRTGYPRESIQLKSRLLDDLNIDSIKAGELVAAAAKAVGAAGKVEPARYSNASLEEIAAALAPHAASIPAAVSARAGGGAASAPAPLAAPAALAAPPVAGEGRMAALVLELTAKLTGYPAESIQPGSRLLDDLNIDSIKAGELVATAAKAVGLAGKIEPGRFANASVADIAQALEQLLPGRGATASPPSPALPTASPAAAPAARPPAAAAAAPSGASTLDRLIDLAAEKSGYPRSSIPGSSRLLDDLNLDSIKAGELLATLTKELGLAGQIEVGRYSNSSLAEVASAFDDARGVRRAAAPAAAGAPLAAAPGHGAGADGDPSAVVQAIAAELTGFAQLSPDAHITRDLNLDPPRVKQLLERSLAALGLPTRIDLAPFLDRTLAQLAAVLTGMQDQARSRPDETAAVLAPAADVWVRNFRLEMVDEPAAVRTDDRTRRQEDRWEGAEVLVICEDDDPEVGAAIHRAAMGRGARAEVTSYAESARRGLAREQRFSHLIAVLPRTPGPGEPRARVERALGRLCSVAAVPHAEDAPRRRTTVAYVQFGGGNFDRGTPRPSDPEICCTTAFARSMHLERDDLRVRVIDLSLAVDPGAASERVLDELVTTEPFAAVGFDGSMTRRVERLVLQDPDTYPAREVSIGASDVVLVTGGGRGITAECALALGRSTGATFALVGRTGGPDSDPELARTMERFQTERVRFRYYSCDVADAESVRTLVRRVSDELGRITMVIHGAGLARGCRADNLSPQGGLKEVAPKVLGFVHLVRALEKTPPRLFVSWTSISMFQGMPWSASYSFSNELLDLLSRRYREQMPETTFQNISWGVWGEVGGAVKLGTVHHLHRLGVHCDELPVAEAVRRFVQLVQRDPGDCQTVVTTRSTGFLPWSQLRPPQRGFADLRYIENVQRHEPDVELVARTRLHRDRDHYLVDHVWRGMLVLPTVFALEAVAQAAVAAVGRPGLEVVALEDVQMPWPVVVDARHGEGIELRALVHEPTHNGQRRVSVSLRSEQSAYSKEYVTATVVLGVRTAGVQELVALPDPLPIDPRVDLYGPRWFVGPRFQRLLEVHAVEPQLAVCTAQARAASFRGDDVFAARPSGSWTMVLGDPYCRDVMIHSAFLHDLTAVAFTLRIGRIDLMPQPALDQRRILRTRVVGSEGSEIEVEVAVHDDEGRILETISGYRLRFMERRSDLLNAADLVSALREAKQRPEKVVVEAGLSSRVSAWSFDTPAVVLEHLDGIERLPRPQRHQAEKPFLLRAVGEYLASQGRPVPGDLGIGWTGAGKPQVTASGEPHLEVSLTHEEGHCLVVAGSRAQGCDLVTLTPRSRGDWLALLGQQRMGLLDQLEAGGDSMDVAGARIWGALEAARKASGVMDVDLAFDERRGEEVVVRTSGPDQENRLVLTLPWRIGRGTGRLIALVVYPRRELAARQA
jgi:acyl transferase domain-containing protein/NADP-dependent 3-hydroxy acid dehydrogenase YdfG/acyl carrier protein